MLKKILSLLWPPVPLYPTQDEAMRSLARSGMALAVALLALLLGTGCPAGPPEGTWHRVSVNPYLGQTTEHPLSCEAIGLRVVVGEEELWPSAEPGPCEWAYGPDPNGCKLCLDVSRDVAMLVEAEPPWQLFLGDRLRHLRPDPNGWGTSVAVDCHDRYEVCHPLYVELGVLED